MKTKKNLSLSLILFGALLCGCSKKPADQPDQDNDDVVTSIDGAEEASDSTINLTKLETYLKENNIDVVNASTYPDSSIIYITSRSIGFNHLEIGNYSKIIIDNGQDSCTVIIDNFKFGKNCEIIAGGKDGANGGQNMEDNWIKSGGWWQAPSRVTGAQGITGLPGQNGTNGTNVKIQLGILSFGTLSITSKGGNGGDGGRGGNGQIGGHHAGGGKGGTGGTGGTGGAGGYLDIKYWPVNSSVDLNKMQAIAADSKRGKSGNGGVGGDGGHRGDDSNPHGFPGDPGAAGGQQADGIVKLVRVTKPF